MPDETGEQPLATGDRSQAILELGRRFLTFPTGEHPDPLGLLGEIATAFAVPRAGLICLPNNQAITWPDPEAECTRNWAVDADTLTQVRRRPQATSVQLRDGTSRLACGIGPSWVLWLATKEAAWTEGEMSGLALVAQLMARWMLAESQPRWAEQLERADRRRQLEHAALVTRRLAHDFGNVLTGILGFTELALAQQIPTNTPLYSYLTEAYKAAQNGAQFTHQLRLFSRRHSTKSRGCELGPIFAEQEARLFACRESGVNLIFHLPQELPAVGIDAEQLHQVLVVLLDNARESLVGPGSISMAAREVNLTEPDCLDLFGTAVPGRHVEITIADTGTGLTSEIQKRLFSELFFTTKPRRRGFGLAVAYGILAAHQGALQLYPGADRGTVARVVLPLAPDVPTGAVNAVGQAGNLVPRKVTGERILVVDDERDVLHFVSATLEEAGYRIESAPGGESALEAYSRAGNDPFALVLSDIIMPRMNGVELVRRLLQRDSHVKVLFMSAQVSSDFTQRDFAGQGYDLLPKPFRPEALLRAVRAALDRPMKRPVGREAGSLEPTVISTPKK